EGVKIDAAVEAAGIPLDLLIPNRDSEHVQALVGMDGLHVRRFGDEDVLGVQSQGFDEIAGAEHPQLLPASRDEINRLLQLFPAKLRDGVQLAEEIELRVGRA